MHRVARISGHLEPRETAAPAAGGGAGGSSSGAEAAPLVPVFTREQLEAYERDGFIVVKGCVPLADIKRYHDRFVDICEGRVFRAPMMTLLKDVALPTDLGGLVGKAGAERAVTKVQHFEDDPVLFEYSKHPSILKHATALIGPDVMSVHTMLINKPPDNGTGSSRHPFHQDLYYFPFRGPILAAWTAMERVHRGNGCLSVIPGSHKGVLLPHEYPKWNGQVNKAYHGIIGLGPDPRRVHVEMDAGDTVFFHSLLIHGSGTNRTPGFRKAICMHMAASSCEYIDVTGTLQDGIAREVEDLMKLKGVEGMSFVDLWKYKSRLVSGREGKMSAE